MALPRPKALSGINGEEMVRSTSSETIHVSMNDLLEERRRFEQYTRDQNARLNRLRELINEEKAGAAADLEKRRAEIVAGATAKLKAELDEARQLWQEQEKTQARTHGESLATQAEMRRLREQLDEVPRIRKHLEDTKAETAKQASIHQQVVRKFQADRDAAIADALRLKMQAETSTAETARLQAQIKDLREESDRLQAQHAELTSRCRQQEEAVKDTAQLRQELQRVQAENTQHVLAAQAMSSQQEAAAKDAAQLRQELQRVQAENAQHQRAAQAVNGLRDELARARAEMEVLQQRDRKHVQELQETRETAAARMRAYEAKQKAAAEKAQELCRLFQGE